MSSSWKPLQDLQEQPKLVLHSLHSKDPDKGIQPVPCEVMLDVVGPLAGDFKAPAKPAQGVKDVTIRLESRHLVVAPTDGDATKVTLLYAEVRLGKDMKSGYPLLVVAGTEGGTIWLVLVDGNENAGRRMLSMMGEVGAIRSDFSKHFSFNPKPLGSGSNAAVYKVQAKCPQGEGVEDLVAKIGFVQGNDQQEQESIPKDVRLEVELLTEVQRHPNIVGFHGLFRHIERLEDGDEDKPQHTTRWIVTLQFCAQGDLFNLVSKAPVSEARGKEVAQGLLSALAHVHSCGIVHRDVKPENMLVTADGRPLLADFGISCHVADSQQMQRRCGSPSYAAPEILAGKPYGVKVDCFSAGSLTFFILSGKLPFDGPNIAAMLRRTERCVVDFDVSPLFKILSDKCRSFILMLLKRSPDDRPTAAVAGEHEWIQLSAPERRRKSNTAAPGESQRLADLAETAAKSQRGRLRSPEPMDVARSSASPQRQTEQASQASSSSSVMSPRPPPQRRDRLGSLTGPAQRPPVTRNHRFFSLQKVFKAAKKEGDSFARDEPDSPSQRSELRSNKSDSDDESEEEDDENSSRRSFNSDRQNAEDETGRPGSTLGRLGRQFRRIMSPRRPSYSAGASSSNQPATANRMTTPVPASRPSQGGTGSARLGSPQPETRIRNAISETPRRLDTRSRTVDPGALRPGGQRNSIHHPGSSSSMVMRGAAASSPQPPARHGERLGTADSNASRTYGLSRLGSIAQQLTSRVSRNTRDGESNSDEQAQDDSSPKGIASEQLSERASLTRPVAPKAPPPQKRSFGWRRTTPMA